MSSIKNVGNVLSLAIDRASLGLAVVGGAAALFQMITMLADGISRAVSGSIPGAFETSKVLMVVIAFLPQGFTEMRKRHIFIDLFTRKMRRRPLAVLTGVTSLLGGLFFSLVTVLTFKEAWLATLTREYWIADFDYPIWQFRWVLAVGVAFLSAQMLRTTIEEFSKALERE
jgi:TRAP-type C4-dicarboxylate transport system permease small subunit